MSEGDLLSCERHGLSSAETFVCQHLADGSAQAFHVAQDPTPEAPFPDAWCERCELVRVRCGGWQDESEAFASIKLWCAGCYQQRRLLLPAGAGDERPFPLLYRCGSCNETHRGLPSWGAAEPDPWTVASDAARADGVADSDLCRLGDDFFIRGRLEIPIHGMRERLTWGVWASLSETSFDRIVALWEAPERALEPPFFGWIMTGLPEELYPDTMHLESHVHLSPPGQQPRIILEATDHPLAVDQRLGISPARAEELAVRLLAGTGGSRVSGR